MDLARNLDRYTHALNGTEARSPSLFALARFDSGRRKKTTISKNGVVIYVGS